MAECIECGDEIPEGDWGPDEAVEDGMTDELVMHQFDPEDSHAVCQTDYYCDPQCAAAQFGGVSEDGSDGSTGDSEQSHHERRASKEREEWIDEDGDDTLPVFVVSRRAPKYHKRYGGCTDPEELVIGFDLFAAELEGYDPCNTCFADDQYVDTEPHDRASTDGGTVSEGVDHFTVLCSGMRPGLLVTVNNSGGATGPASEEMEVVSWTDEGVVLLSGHGDRTFKLRHDSPRGTILEEIDGEGYGGREIVVETIEVIGVAE